MNALRRILALMIKEFLAILKEPKSRFVVIGPPIIQMLIFGYAATYDLTRVPIAVLNEDDGLASRDLLARFDGSPNFRLVATLTHDGQIAPLINDRKVLIVVHVAQDFSSNLLSGRPGQVQIILDGRNSNTALVALGYVQSIMDGFSQAWAEEHGVSGPAARLVTRAWFNPNLLSRWFFIPGLAGQLTLVVTILLTGLSVAREREQGTFDQLLVTPLRPAEILLGKALPGFLIGLFEATLIIVVGVLWFDVPLRGSLATLYLGVVLFLVSAIGVGLMISSLAVTMQQALLGAFLFLTPAIILSGFTTPIANMPPLVQKLTLLNPMRYFLVILRGVFLEGATAKLLVHQLWPMALIGLVSLLIAGSLFRRRLY